MRGLMKQPYRTPKIKEMSELQMKRWMDVLDVHIVPFVILVKEHQ